MSTVKAHPPARPGFASRSAAFRFADDGRPVSLDEKARSIEFVAATEVPTLVWDWERWDLVNEALLMSGCRLPASGRCVFLDTHSRHSVSAVIGSFREQRIANGKTGREIIGRAYYSSTPDGEAPYVKTCEGHVTDVSIGYEIHAYVWIEEGQTTVIDAREFTGPMRVVTDWSLKELSLCPIGADDNAKVRAAAVSAGAGAKVRHKSGPAVPGKSAGREQAKEQPMNKRKKARSKNAAAFNAEVLRLRARLARAEEESARAKLREAEQDEEERENPDDDDDEQLAAGSAPNEDDADSDEEERNDGLDKDEEDRADGEEEEEEEQRGGSAIKRERSRIAEIRGICNTFDVPREQEDKYVRKGTPVNTVRKEVMSMLGARRGGPALAGSRSGAVQPSRLVADAQRRAGKGAM